MAATPATIIDVDGRLVDIAVLGAGSAGVFVTICDGRGAVGVALWACAAIGAGGGEGGGATGGAGCAGGAAGAGEPSASEAAPHSGQKRAPASMRVPQA
jgi:hypothetical protein